MRAGSTRAAAGPLIPPGLVPAPRPGSPAPEARRRLMEIDGLLERAAEAGGLEGGQLAAVAARRARLRDLLAQLEIPESARPAQAALRLMMLKVPPRGRAARPGRVDVLRRQATRRLERSRMRFLDPALAEAGVHALLGEGGEADAAEFCAWLYHFLAEVNLGAWGLGAASLIAQLAAAGKTALLAERSRAQEEALEALRGAVGAALAEARLGR